MKEFINGDCMKYLPELGDNYFDLAIIDPPYGIKRSDNKKTIGKNKSRKNSYIKRTDYGNKKWDSSIPDKEYFIELQRVSKYQIIWGGNYFTEHLKPVNSWIIWNKVNTMPTYSDGEMAWSNLKTPMKIVPLKHSGFRRGQSVGENSPVIYNIPYSGSMDIHPTQKPVQLYKWLLNNFADRGMRILDTHVGSGSSLISFEDFGCEYVGFEIDKDYYEAAKKRLKQHKAQLKMF